MGPVSFWFLSIFSWLILLRVNPHILAAFSSFLSPSRLIILSNLLKWASRRRFITQTSMRMGRFVWTSCETSGPLHWQSRRVGTWSYWYEISIDDQALQSYSPSARCWRTLIRMIPWCLILPICTRRIDPVTKRRRGNGRGSKSRAHNWWLRTHSNQGTLCRISELFFFLPSNGCLDCASTFVHVSFPSHVVFLISGNQFSITLNINSCHFCHSDMYPDSILAVFASQLDTFIARRLRS